MKVRFAYLAPLAAVGLALFLAAGSARADDPPVAEAGPDQSVPLNGTVRLNGSGSYDPEGGALSYRWTQVSGPRVELANATGPNPFFPADREGVFVFALVVFDPLGQSSAADYVRIEVSEPAGSPPVIAGVELDLARMQEDGVVGVSVEAYDPDGDDLAYFYVVDGGWILGKGPRVLWLVPRDGGYHVINLTAGDGVYLSAPVVRGLTVPAPGSGPRVWFASPPPGGVLSNGTVIAGGCSGAARVELSANGGGWEEAALDPETGEWTYLWRREGTECGPIVLTARATDESGAHGFMALQVFVSGDDPAANATCVTEAAAGGSPGPVLTAPQAAGLAAGVAIGTVVVVGAVVGGTEWGRYWFIGLLVPLYSRIKGEDVLTKRTRWELLGYIQENPECHYTEIKQDLHLTNGVLAHHLQVLEREEFIISRRKGRKRVFYPKGDYVPPYTLTDIQQRIVEEVMSQGGLNQQEISRRTGLKRQTVNKNVRKLVEMNVLMIMQMGRDKRVFVDPFCRLLPPDKRGKMPPGC